MRRQWGILMAAFFLATGCLGENKDISNLPEYAPLIGKAYRTKVDLVLFRLSGDKGFQIGAVGEFGLPTKEELSRVFPSKYKEFTILAVLPSGSEFKLQEGQGYIYAYVEITKSVDPQWIGKVASPNGLTEVGRGKEATFAPKYVEEVPGK